LSRIPGIGRDPPTAGTSLSNVITKPRIIGFLAILVVCFLILRSGEESSDSGNQSDDVGAATDRRPRPRTSAFPTPSHNPGMVGRPGAQNKNIPPLYGKGGFHPEQPYPGVDHGGYGSLDPYGDPYGARTRIHTDDYRFRPLAEQEQEQRQTPDPARRRDWDRYAMPHNPLPRHRSSPQEQPQPTRPAPYPPRSAYADHPWEIYDFRPVEKSPGARGRWQGPYGPPDRHLDPYPPDPWSPSSPPQWGSTPPSQRMYPSLSPDPDRRLTTR